MPTFTFDAAVAVGATNAVTVRTAAATTATRRNIFFNFPPRGLLRGPEEGDSEG